MDRKEKSKVEKLFEGRVGKERRDSIGCIDEMLKRKRGELNKSGEKEEVIFKRSNIIERSPDRKREREREGLEKWMKEMGGKIDRIISWMEDVKEEFRKQENKWKEIIEEMRRDFKTQRKEREREKMKGDMRDLKKRLEILEQNERQEEEERQRWGEGERKNMMEKIKRIEKSMESREKEKRRRNIIIKGMEVKEGKRREAVEEILEVIGAKVEIKEVRKIG